MIIYRFKSTKQSYNLSKLCPKYWRRLLHDRQFDKFYFVWNQGGLTNKNGPLGENQFLPLALMDSSVSFNFLCIIDDFA